MDLAKLQPNWCAKAPTCYLSPILPEELRNYMRWLWIEISDYHHKPSPHSSLLPISLSASVYRSFSISKP
ncbi:hypothetical protein L1887_33021 [Cichorium endivia]|nr:hypothetical protein L1887_33021 [Cichorium endivia]